MGLVMRFDLYLMFVMLMGLGFTISNGYKFYVGGKDGWVPTPSEDYSHWSHRNRFQVNDTLRKSHSSFLLYIYLYNVSILMHNNFEFCKILSTRREKIQCWR